MRDGWQVPALVQKLPVAQSRSRVHAAGQNPSTPLHTRFPAHGVSGLVPAGNALQIPSVLAPLATVHTSHAPWQDDVQQTFSLQA